MQELTNWTDKHWLIIVITLAVSWIVYEIGRLIIKSIVRHVCEASAKHNRKARKSDIEKRGRTLAGLFITFWRIVVSAIVVMIILTVLFPHISFAPLFASAGIVGVAVGFGAQSIVKDFLSGIFIIAENQYRVGDVIEIGGFDGIVERIGIRSTVFRDADGNVHFFPNGQVQHVVNKTMGYGMSRMTIEVSPKADVTKVIQIIDNTAADMAKDPDWKSKIIDVPHFTSLSSFSAASVTLAIDGKTLPADQWEVTAELRHRLFDALKKHDIPLS